MIQEGWKIYKLSELCTKITDGSHFSPKVSLRGTKLIATVRDMSDYGFDLDQCKRITDEDYQELVRNGCNPQKGDVLYSKDGTIGLVQYVKEDMELVLLSSIAIFRPNEDKINGQFLSYCLKNPSTKKNIKDNYKSGSALPRIVLKDFKKLELEIPQDLDNQSRIASILSSLDDKIELNLQMNKTLETIAQAIFKEWFVDFRFPGFDGELVDGLPKGWGKVKVAEICETTDFVANGSFASLKENVHLLDEEDYAIYVRTTDYNSGFDKGLKYVNKDSYDFLKKSKLFGNEVIISNVGDVGTVFRPPVWLNKPMTLGSNAVMITESCYNNYLFYFLSGDIGQHLIDGIISGSAQPKFNKTSLRNLELVIPSKVIIENFNTIINNIIFKLNLNNANNRTLIQMRNELLPRLMTGKIKVA